MADSKICLITPYFGKLPSSIDLWLKSCEWNKDVHFLVFSDCKKDNLPSNVIWKSMTLAEFKQLTEEKLGFAVLLETPYECCDFKVAYGEIFSEYLEGYDYWGFCDMDMVFGDLMNCFRNNRLEEYDKFHAWGHMTLFRNTEENNTRYKLSCTPEKGYREAFTTKGITHFDEDEINKIFHMYGYSFYDKRVSADITPACKRMKLGGKGKNYKHQVFFWQNGKIWRAYEERTKTWRGIEVEEFAYIHFQRRSMNAPNFDVKQAIGFYITSDGFVEKKEIGYPSRKDIDSINPYKGAIVEKKEYMLFRIRKKLGKYKKK